MNPLLFYYNPDMEFPTTLLRIPTLIGLRAFDLVSSPVFWEAATNNPCSGFEVAICIFIIN